MYVCTCKCKCVHMLYITDIYHPHAATHTWSVDASIFSCNASKTPSPPCKATSPGIEHAGERRCVCRSKMKHMLRASSHTFARVFEFPLFVDVLLLRTAVPLAFSSALSSRPRLSRRSWHACCKSPPWLGHVLCSNAHAHTHQLKQGDIHYCGSKFLLARRGQDVQLQLRENISLHALDTDILPQGWLPLPVVRQPRHKRCRCVRHTTRLAWIFSLPTAYVSTTHTSDAVRQQLLHLLLTQLREI